MEEFVGRDKILKCSNCGYETGTAMDGLEALPDVLLHTLHHGSVKIQVMDVICHICSSIIVYDGFDDSVFCSNKFHAFTGDDLDLRVHDICCTGITFREARSSWIGRNSSQSSIYYRVGSIPSVTSQRANDAINAYMLLIRFSEQEINEIFTCSNCEEKLTNGSKRMSGVVMNGTAAGVLGVLLNFHRNKTVVPPVN